MCIYLFMCYTYVWNLVEIEFCNCFIYEKDIVLDFIVLVYFIVYKIFVFFLINLLSIYYAFSI